MNNLFLTLALFLTLFSLGTSIPSQCPTPESLYPCGCNRMAYGLNVVCANFEDNEYLIRAFKVLRDYKVQHVVLHGLTLKEMLPTDLFNGLEINEMTVEKSNLKFPQPAFAGLNDSLRILNVVKHSAIKSPENFSLAKLNNLAELYIRAIPLQKVGNDWLNGKIPNVKSIRLHENNMSVIEKEAFAKWPKLELISIAENRIKTVKRSMFPRPADFLISIELSFNEITSLPEDIFHQMPNLKNVILSGNALTTLPEMIWKPIWQDLDTVLLFETNLVCDSNLDWLKDLSWPKEEVNAKCVAPGALIGKTLEEVYKSNAISYEA